ncbi:MULTISPECIES: 50S ribosomal protein L7/L12 [Holospora]|uniref:Large ribosomal subunit protein bL12 n=2 Tax=Holospora TaxID=44747 RepID=A0A061JI54_9PROT|nr:MULTISPECIES: 50S ribosomal protein L7/L12 [Holospora]ETZ04679.1 50S ribosomal protein L7/L12 [Holospora undulata HU1]GAJ46240.1 50S ribosomal protein L7/L12 [Holospora elegans E1]
MDAKLLQIREQLDTLTILEVAALVKELESHWGVSASAPIAMVAPGAASAGAAVEEQTEFKVILKGVGSKKLEVIKEIRAITGLGLGEAKAASETPDFVVKADISKADADKIAQKFKDIGAVISVE